MALAPSPLLAFALAAAAFCEVLGGVGDCSSRLAISSLLALLAATFLPATRGIAISCPVAWLAAVEARSTPSSRPVLSATSGLKGQQRQQPLPWTGSTTSPCPRVCRWRNKKPFSSRLPAPDCATVDLTHSVTCVWQSHRACSVRVSSKSRGNDSAHGWLRLFVVLRRADARAKLSGNPRNSNIGWPCGQ